MRGRNRNNGGGNNNNKGPNPLTRSYESNGPDVKVRGNAQTIAEKYMQLARDAMSSGDPVGAESYYQHAEHYVRIVLAAHEQLRQQYGENYRPQRPFGLQDQDDEDDDGEEAAEATVQPARRGEGEQPEVGGDDEDMLIADEMPARPMRDGNEPRPRFNDQRGEGRQQEGRQHEGRRFDRDRQGGERQVGERQNGGERHGGDRVNGERRFDRERDRDRDRDRNERQDRDRTDRDRNDRGDRPARGDNRGERRFDRPREDGRRDDNRRDESRRDDAAAGGGDDVGALPAFLMTPTRTVAAEPARPEAPRAEVPRAEAAVEAAAPAPAAPVDEAPAAPAPKRRGRPPRKREEGIAEAPGE
jgi:hypothetical protein